MTYMLLRTCLGTTYDRPSTDNGFFPWSRLSSSGRALGKERKNSFGLVPIDNNTFSFLCVVCIYFGIATSKLNQIKPLSVCVWKGASDQTVDWKE